MEKTQNQYDRIAGFFFLGVGAFFSIYSSTIEIGAWNEPGPGFLPFWGGITLALMSAGLLAKSRRAGGPVRPPFFPQSTSLKRVLATFGALVAYNLIFETLGFTLTTFLFVGFLVRFIFPQSWLRTVVLAVSSSIVARLLFVDFLQTQLPPGILGL